MDTTYGGALQAPWPAGQGGLTRPCNASAGRPGRAEAGALRLHARVDEERAGAPGRRDPIGLLGDCWASTPQRHGTDPIQSLSAPLPLVVVSNRLTTRLSDLGCEQGRFYNNVFDVLRLDKDRLIHPWQSRKQVMLPPRWSDL